MNAIEHKEKLIVYWNNKIRELLQDRNNLKRDDLEYLVSKIEHFKDDRLKQCVTTLIGWGDDERTELETFCAVALELMEDARPSRIREAHRRVETRYLIKGQAPVTILKGEK